MKIEILPYRDAWSVEFRAIARELRRGLGFAALRIDHIGSTSIPNLPAKDIIDIQLTVASIDPSEFFIQEFAALGYDWLAHITEDHIPPGMQTSKVEWRKLFFVSQTGSRRVNVHVRMEGKPNQRYALLFRDYLREHPVAAGGYAEIKRQLACYHSDNIDAYYDVKDPVCDIIIAGAEVWALASHWQVGPSDA